MSPEASLEGFVPYSSWISLVIDDDAEEGLTATQTRSLTLACVCGNILNNVWSMPAIMSWIAPYMVLGHVCGRCQHIFFVVQDTEAVRAVLHGSNSSKKYF